ncbi:sigma 54-interacting transcriptional regulator [Duganella sp. CT11-25]|jgi:two-component system nitrogen regulation response regulator GlnG|uniref:sigma 54-interacting transcriptional regulator n=1 Tax=unclassified Duganella TaxID=2636909 RepID=UPI0039B0A7D7
MQETDCTMTSPLSALRQAPRPLLTLTILWHPDPSRAGQQFIGPDGTGEIALGRYAPLFQAPGGTGQALDERCVARDPLRLRLRADGDVDIAVPDSRMVVELNGMPLADGARLARAQVDAGAVLSLGGLVLLCVHWMHGLPQASAITSVLGVSSAAVRLRAQIAQVAATEMPVLLLGQTGSGKEVAARAIHQASRRAGAPLVCVNMATLSESLAAADLFGAVRGAYTGAQTARPGLFAEAAGGTLFLDEIGDTPAPVQPMLLRVLDSGEYRPLGATASTRSSARLIAATDRDLQSASFNQPLLRRLEAFVIALPSLRQRREDIGLLIAHFLAQEDSPPPPAALVAQLCRHDWPGNIRQLAHAVRRIAIGLRAGEVPAFDTLAGAAPPMPAAAGAAALPPRVRLADLSDQDIIDALDQHGWEIQAAAQALGMSRPSLYKRLEQHPRIRRVETIPAAEIAEALQLDQGDLARSAARLQTPREALRRHLRGVALATGRPASPSGPNRSG